MSPLSFSAYTAQTLSLIHIFSPSFSENSFDPVLLCYAIAIIDDKSGFGLAILNRIFKEACPEISSVDFSNVDVDLELLLQTEVQFYAALAICSIHYRCV